MLTDVTTTQMVRPTGLRTRLQWCTPWVDVYSVKSSRGSGIFASKLEISDDVSMTQCYDVNSDVIQHAQGIHRCQTSPYNLIMSVRCLHVYNFLIK